MKTEIKGCLFDLDGVIVDTAKYHFLAWQEMAHELGIPFTEVDNERLKGVSRMDSLEIILSLGQVTLTQKEKEALAERKNQRYLEYVERMTPAEILPGVVELLVSLRAQGKGIALGSASRNARLILQRVGLLEHFDHIVDGTSIAHAKPHPEVFLRGAFLLGLEPHACLVFEDAAAGIEAASRAGMQSIGIGDPHTLRKATRVVTNLVHFKLNDMNPYITIDPWCIIEEQFLPERVKSAESLFSIGNGALGGRANFEETYTAESFPGNYIGGVYYPDKTRVGWWKNGYPEYFAKVLNSAFWIGIRVKIDDQELDLAQVEVRSFRRVLDMKRGVLSRQFEVVMPSGIGVKVESERLVSLTRTEVGAIRYSVTTDRAATLEMTPYVDANVMNEDANYDEKFWEWVAQSPSSVTMRTKKSHFSATWHQEFTLQGEVIMQQSAHAQELVAQRLLIRTEVGKAVILSKYVGITSSLNHTPEALAAEAEKVALSACRDGFDTLLREQRQAWDTKWASADVIIDGDAAAQQGIRFCIFQLLQTYTGEDSRLNVGPKGFTGEKYGGSTYWDTEAYCLPFYLATAGEGVARQLLEYRFNQLDRAIENGAKLGFKDGAALYPMVTMNGEECHNEWEITFEEIHRNGAIAYAIHNYIRYTGNQAYLTQGGLEVLVGIARFWAQRITFSTERGQYVMLGVTGPNEYENNVNNNWYTSYLATWCLNYTAQAAEWVRTHAPEAYQRISTNIHLDYLPETTRWKEIAANVYLPQSKELGIFLQQDGYLDKEQILARELDPAERPLNQKWSWDRILRSCFIKQADVLQGIYLFEEDFDTPTIRRNFEFYEARTVHESSLSPCVHSILASRIDNPQKAYQMYLRAARLDLDDYNREIEEGLHITSMAGSWLSVVEGFGGMRVREGELSFTPCLPQAWRSLSFKVNFRASVISVQISAQNITLSLEQGSEQNQSIPIRIDNQSYTLVQEPIHIQRKN